MTLIEQLIKLDYYLVTFPFRKESLKSMIVICLYFFIFIFFSKSYPSLNTNPIIHSLFQFLKLKKTKLKRNQ